MKSSYRYSTLAVSFLAGFPAFGQIATSNEDGATGAYSSEVESSFTSEGRFGPKTAIDDLRADVDRERETVERVRLKQLQELRSAPPESGPPPPPSVKPDPEPPEAAPQP